MSHLRLGYNIGVPFCGFHEVLLFLEGFLMPLVAGVDFCGLWKTVWQNARLLMLFGCVYLKSTISISIEIPKQGSLKMLAKRFQKLKNYLDPSVLFKGLSTKTIPLHFSIRFFEFPRNFPILGILVNRTANVFPVKTTAFPYVPLKPCKVHIIFTRKWGTHHSL